MNEKEFLIYRERAEKFLERLKNEFFFETRELTAEVRHSVDPVTWADRIGGTYVPIRENGSWGGLWESGWFHITGTVPAEWAGEAVWFKLELGGEIMVFDDAGVPVCGLTNTSVFASNYRKNLLEFTSEAKGGETIDFYAEVAGNGLLGDEITPGTDWRCEVGVVRHLKVGRFNVAAWELCNDFEVLLSLLKSLPSRSYRAVQLNMALNDAVSAYADNPDNAAAARTYLAGQLELRAADSALSTTAVGHAHIDTGWLWPVRETIRKSARTFSSQLYNMERYPEYVFGASQPQHYAFVKKYYPELYAKVKEKVAEGRWEVQGGMWVEADCNIISGESMVRQFLHGKNFFMDEFGIDVKNLWLPDVFGYSAAMPQIIRRSGCDYFLTQKISWSQFNKFPYHTFFWRGIDNTEVLTHFPPEDNYNSALKPEQLSYAQDNFNENHFLPEFMTLFGVGDGGGGPRPEHIEHGLRTADLEGCPKVKFGRADAFFERLAEHADRLPSWVGELYLELHRGTLTTQSRTKRNNRKCEQLLTMTEFICSCLPAAEYPAAELDELWKTLLINQFHDIIPGSSVREVYEVTEKEHAAILAKCEALIDAAAARLLTRDDNAVTVVNTLSCDYTSAVELPNSWAGHRVTSADGQELLTQSENGKLWALGNFPPQSAIVLRRGEAIDDAAETGGELVLENDLVRYEFDAEARLVSAFDKTSGSDVVAGAAANLLGLYVDQPNNWDAWDVDFTYQDSPPEYVRGVRAVKAASGPVRQVLEFELAVGNSTIRQQVVLTENSKRLDFHTEVEWNECRRMLRVAFPTTILTSEASCDIQYGYTRRPTHRNTSWDFARFEVAAHRYVDISDANGGAALLNDCKYGYKLDAGTLDLNLLRSPIYPDTKADLGFQKFTYSFLPHTGGLVGSEVQQEAACLNRAPAVLPGRADSFALPCRMSGGEGVSLEVVKKAEKSDAIVIRLVETDGKNSTAELAFAHGSKLVETNLMEWTTEGEFPIVGGCVELTLRPFEIRTFIIR